MYSLISGIAGFVSLLGFPIIEVLENPVISGEVFRVDGVPLPVSQGAWLCSNQCIQDFNTLF